jgi:hypothetical protein
MTKRRRSFALQYQALVCCVISGCGSYLTVPRAATHPAAAFVEVPYPPPAALPETVPEKPDREVVWVDGEWMFVSSSYVWRRGGWVAPPQVGQFAPWSLRYTRDGRLLMANGSWYDDHNRPMPYVEPLTAAATPPNELTRESQVGR